MVIAATWTLLAVTLVAASPAPATTPAASPTADEPAAKALAKGEYPWYDARADAVKGVKPPPSVEVPASSGPDVKVPSFLGHLGQMFVFFLIALVLAAVIGVIAWSWHRGLFDNDPATARATGPERKATRLGALPAGLDTGSGDPLAEAARLRAKGDYAAAIVFLFAHQLLTLDRLRLARLMPGRTGRQLVRSVSNTAVRDLVTPALRLFEEVYYGHDRPTAEAFEPVWEKAQALERMVAGGVLT